MSYRRLIKYAEDIDYDPYRKKYTIIAKVKLPDEAEARVWRLPKQSIKSYKGYKSKKVSILDFWK